MTTVSQEPRVLRTPAPRHGGHALLGAVLVVAGVVLLLAQIGVFASPWPAVPALLLVLIGGAIVVEGVRGVWQATLVTLAVILTLVTAVSTTASNSWNVTAGGVGDRLFAPTSVTELEDSYELGAGNLRLDLRDLDMPEGTTSLAVDVGVGAVNILVPEDAAVSVRAESGTGEIVLFGERQGGLGVENDYASPDYEDAGRRLELDLSVGMGQIEVTR